VCVHGLLRSARDFEPLARELSSHFRIACPDLAGRGDSDRLPDPALYAVPQYLADMVTLLARLDTESVNWLGTSLGGLVGMALAAQPGTPVKQLVLNDIGPVIARQALERIGAYAGERHVFATFDDGARYMRDISTPFGPHSEAQWRFLAENWLRRDAEGRWQPHYDPRIGEAFRATVPEKDMELWPTYDAVRCPTLVIRGAQSDLLARGTAEQMRARGPKAKLAEIAGVGHAPTLLSAEQIGIVRDFLLQGETP
ncbi:MAG TPA: alpha/beta fold hydrolase, partial [Burkholderiales bacterium]|nr:alpha/beta fold hydrolase [Burkholderiales bacterium]